MLRGRNLRASPRAQRGFTLVELMIVVAIIAVLAMIVIPSFFRESSKARHQAEVTAMLGEIGVKLERYKMESPNGLYLDAARCPATPATTGVDFRASCVTGGSAWEQLRIEPSSTTIYCAYEITTGTAADAPSPPGFTMAQPATAWWYAIAECDMGGNGGTNATFMVSSVDSKLQKLNVGQ